MKLGFLGDSITEGCGASSPNKNYVTLVGKFLNAEVKNYGVGGTKIGRLNDLEYPHIWNMDFNVRTCFIDNDLDYLFVFGGTNDFGNGGIPLGKTNDNTVYTFSGAINTLIDSLSEKIGKDRLIFILPINRFNENNKTWLEHKTLADFIQKMKDVLEYRGVKYIDWFNKLFKTPISDRPTEYFTDGLHPNDKGYKIIAEELAKYIQKLK